MALQIASTVTWGATSSTATSHVSGNVTASSGDYIVVAVASAYDSLGATQPGITDSSSGGPLTWTQRITAGSSASYGFCTVWTAPVSGTPGTFTVTLNNFAAVAHGVAACAWVLTGAAASQAGAATGSRDSGASSEALTVDLNVSAVGSRLFAAIDRGNSTTDAAWRGDCTDDVLGAHFQAVTNGDCSVGHLTSTTSGTGSTLVGSDTIDYWTITAGIEVLAASEVGFTESATATDTLDLQKFRDAYTVFQSNAFQGGAFAILGPGVPPASVPEFSESTTASDSLSPNKVAAIGSAVEQVTASDTLAVAKRAAIGAEVEQAAASDALAVNKRAAIAAATEQVTASDTVALARSIPLDLTESVAASDTIALTLASGATYEITEQATATDAIALARSIPLSLTENATPTDSLALARGLQGTFSESTSTADLWDLTLVAAAQATFQESTTATDTVISAKAIAAALPVESVSATDAFAIARVAGLAFSESTQATDTLGVNKVARLTFSESTIPQDTWDNGAPPPAPSGTPRRTGYFIQWWRRPVMFGPLRK